MDTTSTSVINDVLQPSRKRQNKNTDLPPEENSGPK